MAGLSARKRDDETLSRLRILPEGKRRSGRRERSEGFVGLAFEQRVLTYDGFAARIYGELMGDPKAPGLPMSVPDGQIAAVARLQHMAVAPRNVLDFEHCGIEVLNLLETCRWSPDTHKATRY